MVNNIDLKKLGANIARIRTKKTLSQDQLALEADIGRRTLERLELGQTDVRFTTLVKLADALGIKVKDFLE